MAHGVDADAASQRDQAHDEGQVETVPYLEVIGRQRRLQDGAGRGRQQTADRPGREYADHQAQQYQHLDRYAHPARRLVRLARQVDRLAIEEHIVDEARGIGDGEDAGDGGENRQ